MSEGVVLHACCFKFKPVVIRIGTEENDIADFLSRKSDKSDIEAKFLSKDLHNMIPVEISDDMFTFIGDW
jgi:hypothetical protein